MQNDAALSFNNVMCNIFKALYHLSGHIHNGGFWVAFIMKDSYLVNPKNSHMIVSKIK